MSPIRHFTQLIVWQRAHQLTVAVYRLTERFPRSEVFGLTSQLRRAAVSVSANIAEGFKRQTPADQRHFYTIAAGSLAEAEALLIVARDVGYLPTDSPNLAPLVNETARLLAAWIRGR